VLRPFLIGVAKWGVLSWPGYLGPAKNGSVSLALVLGGPVWGFAPFPFVLVCFFHLLHREGEMAGPAFPGLTERVFPFLLKRVVASGYGHAVSFWVESSRAQGERRQGKPYVWGGNSGSSVCSARPVNINAQKGKYFRPSAVPSRMGPGFCPWRGGELQRPPRRAKANKEKG